MDLRSLDASSDAAHALVAAAGDVFAVFDARTPDSGNLSYGVATPVGRFFVKTAGDPKDGRPLLGFAARVALLRDAARRHRDVTHPALAPLRNVVETDARPHGVRVARRRQRAAAATIGARSAVDRAARYEGIAALLGAWRSARGR